ncbi:HAMP domain-containing sensor histidine kinase [Breoghania sp. L-A4]|uniref:sensor histidine kinase n=1 Tax=Breoghania sp. L-A4 TaxID=2304600 RepID=UPI000E35BA58|nr:HAMP domain-containing sensor histidine kinase [Breoghania sp. L-A4]AXS39229.1 sensor histidine kinase [Breoghania sp. L-A4]
MSDTGSDRRADKGSLVTTEEGADAQPARRHVGLSAKLLVLTISFVMLSEILIFVPSVANFRNTWLADKLTTAGVAAAVLAETDVVSKALQARLLASTDAVAIALNDGPTRRLIAMSEMPPQVDRHIDMTGMNPSLAIWQAFDTLFNGEGRMIRLVGSAQMGTSGQIEIVMPEAPLRHEMLAFAGRILALSLVISVITASLVYISLRWLFVRPLQRLIANMARFAEAPEDPERRIVPSGRADEIGDAEVRLSAMQTTLGQTLHQQRRLADLGLAVSKINHDLRNLLASAQLFLERLETSPDPLARRLAPKIVSTLDRAVDYTRAVMAYGRAQEAPPKRRLVRLRAIVEDVGQVLGLVESAEIQWENRVAADMEVDADPEQIFRVLMNLCRNSVQALQGESNAAVVKRLVVEAERQGTVATIRVADTGPGVPERARAHLFRAFQGSARPGGTGLGLAIAAELVRAHGGTVVLEDTGVGATFRISLPDRPVDIAQARSEHARAARSARS